MIQYTPLKRDKKKITSILETIHNAKPLVLCLNIFPTTSEIAVAYGYDPESDCPTCYRKFKRHATRQKDRAFYKHYPIFAVCSPLGKKSQPMFGR